MSRRCAQLQAVQVTAGDSEPALQPTIARPRKTAGIMTAAKCSLTAAPTTESTSTSTASHQRVGGGSSNHWNRYIGTRAALVLWDASRVSPLRVTHWH